MARKWWTFLTVAIASFMLLLDVTIVNVALPEIERATTKAVPFLDSRSTRMPVRMGSSNRAAYASR